MPLTVGLRETEAEGVDVLIKLGVWASAGRVHSSTSRQGRSMAHSIPLSSNWQ